MAARRLGMGLLAASFAVLVVVLVDLTGVLSEKATVVLDNAVQLGAGLTATGLCWWTSRHVHGPERRWRRLMALGMGGWSVGQVFWSWYQIYADRPLPSPSWADVGYLAYPVMALPALLALAADAPRSSPLPSMEGLGSRAVRAVTYVLDGLVVVGALFVLTWSTALGAVVRAEAPTTSSFLVAIRYPIVDLLLVAIVGLLAMTGRVPSPFRLQLWLLGWGMLIFLVSDSVLAYLVTTGAEEMPPATDVGYILGPLLIGIAALARADDPAAAPTAGASRLAERAHLLLPYVLVALTGAVVWVQRALGAQIDQVESAAAWVVLGLVLLRQIITLVQNTVLLERVSDVQAELAYRAQHDPLTGLANRSLFGERLQGAMEVHRRHGEPYALLLVDLDDFKAINDNLGHTAGDRLLQAVGQRLQHCVRSTDTVARLGGDEFAVVLCGTTEEPGLVGQRIIDALQEPFRVDGQTLSLGASIGVVAPDGDGAELTPELLLRRADGAMYLGKARGKGMSVTYDPDMLHELPSRAPG